MECPSAETQYKDRAKNRQTDPADESYLQSHVTLFGPGGAIVLFIPGGDSVDVGPHQSAVRDLPEEGGELYLVPAFTQDLNELSRRRSGLRLILEANWSSPLTWR